MGEGLDIQLNKDEDASGQDVMNRLSPQDLLVLAERWEAKVEQKYGPTSEDGLTKLKKAKAEGVILMGKIRDTIDSLLRDRDTVQFAIQNPGTKETDIDQKRNLEDTLRDIREELRELYVQLEKLEGYCLTEEERREAESKYGVTSIQRQALNSDILLDSGDPYYYWDVERENGQLVATYEGYNKEKWVIHPGGIVIAKENELVLNGERIIYVGAFKHWDIDKKGHVVVEKMGRLEIDGEIVYLGRITGSWVMHPRGIFMQHRDKLLYVSLIKGTKATRRKRVEYRGKFHKLAVNKAEGSWAIQRGNDELLLFGRTILYRGEFDDWDISRRNYEEDIYNFILQKGNRLLLNGTDVIYEGEFDDWKAHPKSGVIVRKGNSWYFYDKSKDS